MTCFHPQHGDVALRKESVDRNIKLDVSYNIKETVALRKESVDRNLVHIRDRQLGALSLSARRAWIEIRYVDPVPVNYKMSLSARRAWIEISSVWCTCLRAPVALRKESVDRNQGPVPLDPVDIVALRKESVDRNRSWTGTGQFLLLSLSARRAWIEIPAVSLSILLGSGRSPQGERG